MILVRSKGVGPQEYGQSVEQHAFVWSMQDLGIEVGAHGGFFWQGNDVLFEEVFPIRNAFFHAASMESEHEQKGG